MTQAFEIVDFEVLHSATDSLRVNGTGYRKLEAAGLIDNSGAVDDLGYFGLDHGIIYEVIQDNVHSYVLKVLTKEGELKVIPKGKMWLAKYGKQ